MNNEFNFEIISADGKSETYSVTEIICKTTGGEIGILKNHNPLVGVLETSILEIIKGNEKIRFAISDGIINVTKEKVIILVDSYFSKDEIDELSLIEEKKLIKHQLKEYENDNLKLNTFNKKYKLILEKEKLVK